MSTQHALLTKLRTDLRNHDDKLDQGCRATLGISVRVFKILRALTQLLGMLMALYAMHLGVDLQFALFVALAFYVGPEGAERILASRSE